MVHHPSGLPSLRIGFHPVDHYEQSWLQGELTAAAQKAGVGEDWLIQDLTVGVMGYLREACPQAELSLQAFAKLVQQALARLGMQELALHLHLAAPPVQFSFLDLVVESQDCYELGFFPRLSRLLLELAASRTRSIQGIQLRPAILRLTSSRFWTLRCDRLSREILDFTVSTVISGPHSPALQVCCRL